MLYIFGEFELDLRRYELRRGDALCALEPQGFNLLAHLVEHRDRVVSKQELLEQLWPDQSVSEATLTQRLMAARKALGDSGRAQRYIKTVHGRGYRFIANVESRDSDHVASTAQDTSASAPPALMCLSCQHANPAGAVFCNACAAPLNHLSEPLLAEESSASTSETPPPLEAERRQLTVVLCGLVEATQLAERLDPEDYRDVVRTRQTVCADVIQRYGGYLAQSFGDALLIYFGWPMAYEDNAQRAVQAGLDMLNALAGANRRFEQAHGVQLAIRVAVHTGLVVVGEMDSSGHQEQLALGAAPHVAARLHELAQPNTVVVSAATHALAQGYFTWDDLGPQHFTGVSSAMRVYRAIGVSGLRSRFEVAATHGLMPLVGRHQEVALLLERWTQAQDGMGQVVLLSGEAGIGKSRLAQALQERLADEPHLLVEYHGSPYHQHSALHPLIEPLQRQLALHRGDAPITSVKTLEAFLAPYRVPLEEAVPLLGALLSISIPEDRYPPLSWSPERQRQKTLELLLALLVEQAAQQPVVLLVEDLHWVDPTTLSWLDLLVEQTPTTPLLAVLTCRPTFDPPWGLRSYLTPIALQRLPRSQMAAMVTRLVGNKRLPPEVLDALLDKTDGVPLFVEEMTKSVLESGILSERDDHYALTGDLASLRIPATLHDALMARLDHLESAKGVAQLGAVVGRQFSYEWLHAVSPLDEAALQHELSRLVASELLYVRGHPPQATYLFKHALIQETAYQSLLRRTRQAYHRRIAEQVVERFPDAAAAQPELVAYHYTAAGLHEQAVAYWQQAGEQAVQRSAHAEAIARLNQGLEALTTLPDTTERRRKELLLQVALAAPWIATKGYAAPEVRQTYTRAHALCQQIGETPDLFRVLWGLALYYTVRMELHTAIELGEQCLQAAQAAQDPELLLQAHHALWPARLWRGDFVAAYEHQEHGMALYDASQHHTHTVRYGGHDPGACAQQQASMTLWMLGYPDQALVKNREALALSQQLGHPFSRAVAHHFAAYVHILRREMELVRTHTDALIRLCEQHGVQLWLAWGLLQHGKALIELGEIDQGVAQMEQGCLACRETGAEDRTLHLAWLIEGYGKRREPEKGLAILTEALARMEVTGQRGDEAELYRIKGELRLQQSTDHAAEAEADFKHALDVARHQCAKSWELRAATSLARLWQFQHQYRDAYELLAPVYSWFTEGVDTADLMDAKTLLLELAAGAQ